MWAIEKKAGILGSWLPCILLRKASGFAWFFGGRFFGFVLHLRFNAQCSRKLRKKSWMRETKEGRGKIGHAIGRSLRVFIDFCWGVFVCVGGCVLHLGFTFRIAIEERQKLHARDEDGWRKHRALGRIVFSRLGRFLGAVTSVFQIVAAVVFQSILVFYCLFCDVSLSRFFMAVFFCLSVRLSLCLSVCLSVCLAVFFCLSV